MSRRLIFILIIAAALCGLLSDRTQAEDKAMKVPKVLAGKLDAAQKDIAEGRAQQAVKALLAYKGEDHALRQLVLGHAYFALEKSDKATEAYQAALRMNPNLSEAGFGLAQVYVRGEHWALAADLLGRFVKTETCNANLLLLYAQTATQMSDTRLAKLLVNKGIMRFPSDMRFRKQELVLLVQTGEMSEAAEAARMILTRNPIDSVIWQHLAFAKNRGTDRIDQLAALEAALLCEPKNLEAHRNFLSACLASGDWLAVVQRGHELLAGPLKKNANADSRILELLIQAADLGSEDEALEKWLARVEPKKRTRAMRIAAIRLALRRGKPHQARAALKTLIEKNQADGSVFLWAARLAEEAGEWPEAETLYEQARKDSGSTAKLAVLYLARMHIRGKQSERAIPLLKQYLNEQPEDSVARALLTIAKARTK